MLPLKLKRGTLALLMVGLLFCQGALATLLSQSSTYGPDTFTLDTQSGLQWLDLSITVGRSFNDVSFQLGSAGQFSGLRYATVKEVTELFQHATIPRVGAPGQISIEQFNAVDQFMGLVGGHLQNTDPAGLCPSCYGWYSLGLTSDISATSANISPPGTYLGHTYSYLGVTNEPAYGMIFGYANPSADALVDFMGVPVGMGSWLVHPVPVPAAVWLFGSALMGLRFIGKGNSKQTPA